MSDNVLNSHVYVLFHGMPLMGCVVDSASYNDGDVLVIQTMIDGLCVSRPADEVYASYEIAMLYKKMNQMYNVTKCDD